MDHGFIGGESVMISNSQCLYYRYVIGSDSTIDSTRHIRSTRQRNKRGLKVPEMQETYDATHWYRIHTETTLYLESHSHRQWVHISHGVNGCRWLKERIAHTPPKTWFNINWVLCLRDRNRAHSCCIYEVNGYHGFASLSSPLSVALDRLDLEVKCYQAKNKRLEILHKVIKDPEAFGVCRFGDID